MSGTFVVKSRDENYNRSFRIKNVISKIGFPIKLAVAKI